MRAASKPFEKSQVAYFLRIIENRRRQRDDAKPEAKRAVGRAFGYRFVTAMVRRTDEQQGEPYRDKALVSAWEYLIIEVSWMDQ